jgi:tetratricopeptide (TPR) repeat protein
VSVGSESTLLGEDEPRRPQASIELPPGREIGRYIVLGKLGAGGMGFVVAAYDPELDRKVAIKLLHVQVGPGSDVGHRRLLAEAQALARLNDPNVVAVHDVGTHAGSVFVAMEFVEGQTLKAWLAVQRRPWAQVLDVMIWAGRGLAAAHACNLVHRDFKPDNVMLGKDGRVRVMDFGLARTEGEASDTEMSADEHARPRERALGQLLTQQGSLIGTPAYMAPEQLGGDRGGPAADQFSFCVSLWEGIYGQRPFAAETLQELFVRTLDGTIDEPPPTPQVPRWLRRVVERGLAVDPQRRWPSMTELLVALERGRARIRWRQGLLALGFVGAVGVMVVVAGNEESPCRGAQAKLQDVWDEPTRAAVAHAFGGTNVPYAEDARRSTERSLDAYARRWVDQHTETCEATAVRGEQSAEALDLRMACLERARIGLRAVTRQLEEADAEVVERAHGLVDGLSSLDRCADVETLRTGVEPPTPADMPAVQAAQEALAEARALFEIGKVGPAEAALARAEASLDNTGYEPTRTELQLVRGYVAGLAGEHAQAEDALRDALQRAARWGQWDELQEAAVELLLLVGRSRSLDAEGQRYVELARGLAERSGDPSRIGRLHGVVGIVHKAHARYPQAEAEYRAAIAGLEAALEDDHHEVAQARGNLAAVLHLQGHSDEAAQQMQAVVVTLEQSLGELHPDVLATRNNLAAMLLAQGRLPEAEAELRAVVERRTALMGPTSEGVATARDNLANVLRAQGRLPEAVAEHRAALQIWLEMFGPEHPAVAISRNNIGAALEAQGKLDEAEQELRAAVELRVRLSGDAHPSTALARQNLGGVLTALGRHAEAVEELERAWATRGTAATPALERARTAFSLAKALVGAGGERDRAMSLAQQADAAYGEAGAKHEPERQRVRTWLAERLDASR